MTTKETSKLIALYDAQDIPVDRIAYTVQLETIAIHLRGKADRQTCHEIFTALMGLRKAGQLPLKQKKSKEVNRPNFGLKGTK